MQIERRDIGEVTVVDLSGKLTLGAATDELNATIDRLLAEGRGRIVLNLHEVPYMDSAGMGQLMTCHKRALARGGAIKLLNPLKRVYDVLQLVKLDTVFETHQEEARAVESFRAEL